jgi:hypothetical protein
MKTILTMFSFLVMTGLAFAQTPSIVNITPNQGQRGQTLNLQITGSQTNFAQGSNITVTVFNAATAIRANSVAVLSGTNLIANITIPQNANYQLCDVAVSGINMPNVIKRSGFSVVNASGKIPKIKSFTPETATEGQTLNLTISGDGTLFTQASQVQASFFTQASNITVNNVSVIDDTTIVSHITIGSNINTGYYPFYVDASQEGRLYSPGLGLLVYDGGSEPQIVAVNPKGAAIGQTLDLTITGVNVNFSQASGTFVPVFFNGATQLTGNNTTVLTPNMIRTTLVVPNNMNLVGSYDLLLQEFPLGSIFTLQNAFQIGVTTGIDNRKIGKVNSIYPNPTRDELFIDTEHKILSFGLMNTTGQLVVVKPEDLEEQPNGYRISTLKYGLPPGFYFIRIQTIEGYTYHKILIN